MLKFPSKLYRLLQRAETSESGSSTGDTADFNLSDIISWLPCGKAFKIYDPEAHYHDIRRKWFGISITDRHGRTKHVTVKDRGSYK